MRTAISTWLPMSEQADVEALAKTNSRSQTIRALIALGVQRAHEQPEVLEQRLIKQRQEANAR